MDVTALKIGHRRLFDVDDKHHFAWIVEEVLFYVCIDS